MNALGMYLLCSLVFVSGALTEFAIVVVLSRRPTTAGINAINPTTQTVNEDTHAQLRRRIRTPYKLENDTLAQTSNTAIVNGYMDSQEKKNCILNLPSVHTIDLAAFWLFIFFYFSFNCIYWLFYYRV